MSTNSNHIGSRDIRGLGIGVIGGISEASGEYNYEGKHQGVDIFCGCHGPCYGQTDDLSSSQSEVEEKAPCAGFEPATCGLTVRRSTS